MCQVELSVCEDAASAPRNRAKDDHVVLVGHVELHVLHEREVGSDILDLGGRFQELPGAEQVSLARPHQMGREEDREERKGSNYVTASLFPRVSSFVRSAHMC